MKINSLSLPHPILGIADEVDGSFDINLDIGFRSDKTVLSVTHELSNEALVELISSEDALFCAELHCAATSFRQSLTTKKIRETFEISREYLRDKVELVFYIVANRDMEDYGITGMSEIYGNTTFDIGRGDILAYGGEHTFLAEASWQALDAVSNFMVIKEDDRERGVPKVSLSGEKIIIYLAREDYELYRKNMNAGSNFHTIYHSALALPALMYALAQMIQGGDEGLEETGWYRLLDYKRQNDEELKKIGWEISEVYRIAQAILDSPISRTLKGVGGIIDEMNRD